MHLDRVFASQRVRHSYWRLENTTQRPILFDFHDVKVSLKYVYVVYDTFIVFTYKYSTDGPPGI